MPGRLVFSTTADGASSPTERMRISSAGVSTFTGTAIINANASTDALRITQTGTGNVLLVEDAANPDSSPFVVDNTGQLITGYTSAVTTRSYSGTADVTPRVQVHSSNISSSSYGATLWQANTNAPLFAFSKSRSNTIGTVGSVVASGDTLGALAFNGDDGAAFQSAAVILAQVDGTPGTNDMPGRLVFSTTADGASSPTERMRITNAGFVGIGKTPTTTLDVEGTAQATVVRASNGIVVNSQTISENYTIASGDNGGSFGPVTVNSGITVTVSSGSTWTVT
jgi:hypothetical protein